MQISIFLYKFESWYRALMVIGRSLNTMIGLAPNFRLARFASIIHLNFLAIKFILKMFKMRSRANTLLLALDFNLGGESIDCIFSDSAKFSVVKKLQSDTFKP